MAIENKQLGDPEWGLRLDYFQAGERVIELIRSGDPDVTLGEFTQQLDKVKGEIELFSDLVQIEDESERFSATLASESLEIVIRYDMDKDELVSSGAPIYFSLSHFECNSPSGDHPLYDYCFGRIDRKRLLKRLKTWVVQEIQKINRRVLKTTPESRGHLLLANTAPYYVTTKAGALAQLPYMLHLSPEELDVLYPSWGTDFLGMIMAGDSLNGLDELLYKHHDLIKSSPDFVRWLNDNKHLVNWEQIQELKKVGIDIEIDLDELSRQEIEIETILTYSYDAIHRYANIKVLSEDQKSLREAVTEGLVETDTDELYQVNAFNYYPEISWGKEKSYPFALNLHIGIEDDYDDFFGDFFGYHANNHSTYLAINPNDFHMAQVRNLTSQLNFFKKGLTITFWIAKYKAHDTGRSISELEKAFEAYKTILGRARNILGLDDDVDLDKFQMRVRLCRDSEKFKIKWLEKLD